MVQKVLKSMAVLGALVLLAAATSRTLSWSATNLTLVQTTCGTATDGGTPILCPSNTRTVVTQNKSTSSKTVYLGPLGEDTTTGYELTVGKDRAWAVSDGVLNCAVASGTQVITSVCVQ